MSDDLRLSGLFVHPVKSCRAVPVETASVLHAGLDGDRRWMVIDRTDRFQTQRRLPGLARVQAFLDGDGLRLHAEGRDELQVSAPREGAERVRVRIWNDVVETCPAGVEAHRWLSETLGSELRLVRIDSDRARPVDPAFTGEQPAHVSLADGFPLLIVNRASLHDLQARIGRPLDMRRFRPNLVIDGAAAWEEDGWRTLRVGGVRLRVAKPCGRCIMTTLDPDTGESADEGRLLQTLKGFRRAADGDVIFGQNAIPMEEGPIAVGDQVGILERGRSNLL